MNGSEETGIMLTPGPPAVLEASALEVISRSEIDVQIATAHKFRRSLHEFRSLAETMATLDQDTAASCYYKLQRRSSDGKVTKIEGESVRFAEICASAFGNLRYGARLVGEDERSVTAQGFAHDLERNIAVAIEVRRPIVTKTGRRYSDDMVNVTANAACSIAYRNALLKVIPRTLTAPIYAAAKKAAVGDAKTLQVRRDKALAHFESLGLSRERILLRLEKTGIEDLDLDDLELLTGLKTALKEHEISLADAFPVEEPATAEPGDRSSQLAGRIRRGRQPQQGQDQTADPGKTPEDEPGASG